MIQAAMRRSTPLSSPVLALADPDVNLLPRSPSSSSDSDEPTTPCSYQVKLDLIVSSHT